jgi:hypothetical protein
MIRLTIAAKASPDADAEQHRGEVDLPALAARGGEQDVGAGGDQCAGQQRGFDPKRFSSRPVCAPATSIASVEGSRNSPAPVTDAPKR